MTAASMDIEKRIVLNQVVALLYAIAAISGGLGGCAAGCYYFTHDKHPRWAFVVAYIVLGCVFGVVTYAVLTLYGIDDDSVEKIVLFSLGGGLAGAIALASANLSVRLIFRKLGVEVQLTMRKRDQERRKPDDDGTYDRDD